MKFKIFLLASAMALAPIGALAGPSPTLTGGQVAACDVYNPSICASTKASGVVAGATDPALVVTMSPSSAVPTGTGNVNLKQVNGATVDVGVGAAGTGTVRVSTSTDSTIGTINNPVGVKGLDGSTISGPFNPLPVLIVPSSSTGVSTQSCTAACASTLLSGGHGVYGLSASATVTGWVLVYDAVACSANGTVTPKKAVAYTTANATLGVSWSDSPMVMQTGIAVCFSTTGPYTATASTTAFLSVDYK